jgi:DNA-binding CsgD family transcriptional regulator/tetratricopeptide (TPR) repeat protein
VRASGLHPAEAHELLEREVSLEALHAAGAEAARGSGKLVFVSGEAGVGKTALVRRFCRESGAQTVLWGACEALFTPRPLGPLVDMAEQGSPQLLEALQREVKPYEIVSVLTRTVLSDGPAVVVFEDVHWADEATLDVLKLLGRRIGAFPALVVVTYRDDELDPRHPLQIVVGELITQRAVERVPLAPLSHEAVRQLAEASGIDADRLHAATGGNPFFVLEVLAAGGLEIPPTVRDAVLARAARLSPGARDVLEAVAIAPPRIELWLLERLIGERIVHLDDCLASGMVAPARDTVEFRHELARLTVEDSIAPHRRIALHREVLGALSDPPSGAADLMRLSHHAEAAGDTNAVLSVAPAAAARAAELGAHREAAALYGRALAFADEAPLELRAELLEARAYECYLTGQFDDALEAHEVALDCRRKLGDRLREGDSLRSLSRLLRYTNRAGEALDAGREAVSLLEQLDQGRELALAYCNLAHLYAAAELADEAVEWSTRGLELAQRLADVEATAYALTNLGAVEVLSVPPEGRRKLEQALRLARDAGLEELAGRAFVNLVWWTPRTRSYAAADPWLEPGLAYCTERGLDLWLPFLLAYRAQRELDRGRWDEAATDAARVLADPRSWPTPHTVALAVLARIRARRGDPQNGARLDEALTFGLATGEPQRIGPAATASAEAAWLTGDTERVDAVTSAALEVAVARRAWWIADELAYRRWRAGLDFEHGRGPSPFSAQIAGDWAKAHELWVALECPYEAAVALAEADDDDAVRQGLAELHRLGARPAASIVARALRERGARGLARGPRASTRDNPAQLTHRELEVLGLLAGGLHNAEIARRLFLSQRTVDHHVSAILRKLGVRTRSEASAEAVRLGIASP